MCWGSSRWDPVKFPLKIRRTIHKMEEHFPWNISLEGKSSSKRFPGASQEHRALPECSLLAFRQFFNFFVFLIFGHFGTWIAEFSPQNLSPGRKFHAESDFRVKTKKFWRPGAKNEEKTKIRKF